MRIPSPAAILLALSPAAFACHDRPPAVVGTTDDYEDYEEPAQTYARETTPPSVTQVYADADYDLTPVRDTLASAGWERIGDRDVEDSMDKGKIRVGRGERHVSELVVLVDEAPVDIYDMTVLFDDGTSYSPVVPQRFPVGARSDAIRLPQPHAAIREIRFRYGAVRNGEEGNVEVWGR